MNQYEVALLFDPGLEVGLDKATDRVEKIFKDAKGKVLNVDNWGKRKLAYPIKKNEHAIYVFYNIELSPDQVRKVESDLNLTEEVMRFLITRPDLKAMAKAAAAQEEQKKRALERGDRNEDSESSKESEESVE